MTYCSSWLLPRRSRTTRSAAGAAGTRYREEPKSAPVGCSGWFGGTGGCPKSNPDGRRDQGANGSPDDHRGRNDAGGPHAIPRCLPSEAQPDAAERAAGATGCRPGKTGKEHQVARVPQPRGQHKEQLGRQHPRQPAQRRSQQYRRVSHTSPSPVEKRNRCGRRGGVDIEITWRRRGRMRHQVRSAYPSRVVPAAAPGRAAGRWPHRLPR